VRGQIALILYATFSLVWLGFTALYWVGSLMGDCLETNYACLAFKEYGPSLILWRGLAVELAATLIFAFIRMR